MEFQNRLIVEARYTLAVLAKNITNKKEMLLLSQNETHTSIANLLESIESKDEHIRKYKSAIKSATNYDINNTDHESNTITIDAHAITPQTVKETMGLLQKEIVALVNVISSNNTIDDDIMWTLMTLFFSKPWSVFPRKDKVVRNDFARSCLQENEEGKRNLLYFSSLLVDRLFVSLDKQLISDKQILMASCSIAAKMTAQVTICSPFVEFIRPGKKDVYDNSKHDDSALAVKFSIVDCVCPGLCAQKTKYTFLKARVITSHGIIAQSSTD